MQHAAPLIRAGVIGLSWITTMALGEATSPALGTDMPRSHIGALARIPEIELVAGCDLSSSARENLLATWGGTWPNIETCADYADMLANHHLDLIVIAIPDHVHEGPFMAALEARIPMIFTEKPIATSVDAANRMVTAASMSESTVAVNFTRRWMPSYNAALTALNAGSIGELVSIHLHFGGDRAMMWRNHSHMVDLLNMFAQSNPVTAYAELEPGFENYGTAYAGDGGRTADLEPGFEAMISWENGVRGHLFGYKRAWQDLHMELVGTNGRITLDDAEAQLHIGSDQGAVSMPLRARYSVMGMEAALRQLIRAHDSGTETACSPSEARKTALVLDAILRSQAEGNRKVTVKSGEAE